jgi:hypothetical protein
VLKRNGDYVAGVHDTACRPDALSIHPHIAGVGKRRGGGARANKARMPQPPVNPLTLC